ncbi:MAG: Fe-only hydrogenase, fused subunit beta and gamma [Ignavibacteria bacterium]|nr:Fe-only hydrogenase, fused subunit beta and gamma [Ignavibacteria bacterium]
MLLSEKNAMTEEIEELCSNYGSYRESLLPILNDIQLRFGYVSEFAQQEIARVLDIHPVEVYGVVTFYSFLSPKRLGKYIIRLCRTISCDMAEKSSIARVLERELGIRFGETTSDMKFSLEYTNCLGMCDESPAMLINEQVFTKLTPHRVAEIIRKYK